MKVLVLLKEVPQVSEIRINPDTFSIERGDSGNVLNPSDYHAVEAALTLAAKTGGDTTAISMGPASCEDILRTAAGMGIQKAYRITDDAYAGADTLVTARILKKAIDKTGPYDCIICGRRSADGFTSQIPAKLAALLGCGLLTNTARLFIEESGLSILRKAGSGYEKLASDFPLVLSVSEDLNQPRTVNIKGKMAARKLEIPVLSQEELALTPEELKSPSQVLALFPPQKLEAKEFIQGSSAAEKAEKLVSILTENRYI